MNYFDFPLLLFREAIISVDYSIKISGKAWESLPKGGGGSWIQGKISKFYFGTVLETGGYPNSKAEICDKFESYKMLTTFSFPLWSNIIVILTTTFHHNVVLDKHGWVFVSD